MGGLTTNDLIDNVISGNASQSVSIAKSLLAQGYSLKQIVEEGLTKALDSLDNKCNLEQFNLLEILLASRAMKEVIDEVICKEIERGTHNKNIDIFDKGQVFVIGTIRGDIHDLGKNIVATLLKTSGYKVVDLGKDIPPPQFVEAVKKFKARYIGVSSLITSSLTHIREIKRMLVEERLENVIVIAGGAATKQAEKEDLNVDLITENAFDVFHYLRSLEGKGQG